MFFGFFSEFLTGCLPACILIAVFEYVEGDTMADTNKKALIAMSGGVDSSVAAHRMMQAGYTCMGVMMRLYQNEDIGLPVMGTCCSIHDIQDAEAVAARLGIPFRAVNFTAEFRHDVMERFVSIYEQGGTPNPCIDCNRYLKFDRLLQYARSQGCDVIATGHYARIERSADGRWLLKKAADPAKDQSYVLYMLTQEQLEHVRFPLGEITKQEARAIAASLGFPNAKKHDSQDICVVPDGDYAAFLERERGSAYPAGDFVSPAGDVLGQHKGAVRYTVGQRRGLGISAPERLYVIGKDMARNTVTVGSEDALFYTEVDVEALNWIAFDALTEPIRCSAKLRYRMAEQPCTLSPAGDDRVRITFDQPQRAPTAGQAAVFYDGDTVLGGGTII